MPERSSRSLFPWLEPMKVHEAWQLLGNPITPMVHAISDVYGGFDIYRSPVKERVWVNTEEIPNNGVDDDGNGFIDDVNGWDFRKKCNPAPKPVPDCTGFPWHGYDISSMACSVVGLDSTKRPGYKIMSINQEDFFGHSGTQLLSRVDRTRSHIPDSLRYAVNQKARVYSSVDICVSHIAGKWACFVPELKLWNCIVQALEEAETNDLLCFFTAIGSATEFDAVQPYSYPAYYNTVIAVHSQSRPCGPQAELFVSGAPHNCGAVAIAGAAGSLARIANPSLSVQAIRWIFRQTADGVAKSGKKQLRWNATYGYGQLNLYEAIKYIKDRHKVKLPHISCPQQIRRLADFGKITWNIPEERNERIEGYRYCIGSSPGYPDYTGGWFGEGVPGVGGMIFTEKNSLSGVSCSFPRGVKRIHVTVEALYKSGGLSLQARSGPIEIA